MRILTDKQWSFMMKRVKKDITKKQRKRLNEAIENTKRLKK
jgi:hypothetical protein